MSKCKMTLSAEMDLTRDGVAEMTQWCLLIALHQAFGIGSVRLGRVETRAKELAQQSLDTAMMPDREGMFSTAGSRALRESWLPDGAEREFRVPVLRAPRTRREQQLRMAGDAAASMVWTLYAAACYELLGFGADRLNRLKWETLANYEQVNREGHEDGLDVAMEHLRRCACDALRTDDIVVENVPDEERVKQSNQEYEEQKRAFRKNLTLQVLHERNVPAGMNVLAAGAMEQKIQSILQQAAPQESWERRRTARPKMGKET